MIVASARLLSLRIGCLLSQPRQCVIFLCFQLTYVWHQRVPTGVLVVRKGPSLLSSRAAYCTHTEVSWIVPPQRLKRSSSSNQIPGQYRERSINGSMYTACPLNTQTFSGSISVFNQNAGNRVWSDGFLVWCDAMRWCTDVMRCDVIRRCPHVTHIYTTNQIYTYPLLTVIHCLCIPRLLYGDIQVLL